jgi:hypothetical protein
MFFRISTRADGVRSSPIVETVIACGSGART